MSFWTYVLIAIVLVMFAGSFILCCPDRLPRKRRKK